MALSDGAAVTSIVGVVGLIWTVSQFYGTLDIAFSRIFSDRPERDLFRRTARGFMWVAGLIGVVVALIVATSLAAAAEALLPTSSPALSGFGRVMSSPPMVVFHHDAGRPAGVSSRCRRDGRRSERPCHRQSSPA